MASALRQAQNDISPRQCSRAADIQDQHAPPTPPSTTVRRIINRLQLGELVNVRQGSLPPQVPSWLFFLSVVTSGMRAAPQRRSGRFREKGFDRKAEPTLA